MEGRKVSRPLTPFTPDQQAQLLPLLPVYGTTVLAHKFNLSPPRIKALREEAGIPEPRGRKSPPCYAVVLPSIPIRRENAPERPPRPIRSRAESVLRRYPSLPALVAEGKTLDEISEALDITRSYAPELCRALNLKPVQPPPVAIVATRPEILDAIREGRSYRNIAKEFGITHQRVHQIAQQHGIEKPRAKSPGPPKRSTPLTPRQEECLQRCPDILNGEVPATRIDGVNKATVHAIRATLGIKATHSNIGLFARIVEVLDRPMTPAEVAEAVLPMKAAQITTSLSLATKAGKIQRLKYGVYAPLNYVGEKT